MKPFYTNKDIEKSGASRHSALHLLTKGMKEKKLEGGSVFTPKERTKSNKELHKEVNERYAKKHEKAHLKFQGIKSKALKKKAKEEGYPIGKALKHYGHLI